MNSFSGFVTISLAAIFAENVLLSGAADTDLALDSLRKLPRLAAVSLMIALFSLLDSLTMFSLDRLIHADWLTFMPVRGFLLTLIALLWYFIAGSLLRRSSWINRTAGQLIPVAALNGAVLAAPLAFGGAGSIGTVIGSALGAGLGFALAAWLIGIGMRRSDNPDISSGMRGAPAMLIYIGLLALAFSAFGGN